VETERQTEQIAHLGRLALMGEMAASLAHELNQPLTAIVGNAGAGQRFLASGVIDVKELQDLLRDIISDAERAGKIIRGIREMVRKGETRREPVNMNQIVEAVVRLTKKDGLGIGLAIARSIVESFGGVLDASNAPGGGAFFYFTLPAPKSQLHERSAPQHSVCC
jgi:C4-dicarboxylate-specific signal transduction histidine kinase